MLVEDAVKGKGIRRFSIGICVIGAIYGEFCFQLTAFVLSLAKLNQVRLS
jgi:hypothetical protein